MHIVSGWLWHILKAPFSRSHSRSRSRLGQGGAEGAAMAPP
ncbi:hypothetical protein PVAP13_2KG556560 [Panicum virgatum]|uniref:Uncharacterized protein n=1 Tax=Panicum virgatum TaxID=38727 RepID=A0A8T0WDL5_PANVG|nr:hypothetical protein PVAP13_2KG556560 [Panicum virgatum]